MNGYLIHSAVDSAAARMPNHAALRFNGATLTYAELAERSNQLANALIASGVNSRDRVGIYLHKSFESAIAMYGIMKAGAAFVPIDPLLPASRLAFILDDCGIEKLISEPRKVATIADAMKLSKVRSNDFSRLPSAEETTKVVTTNLNTIIGVSADSDLPVTCLPWETVNTNESSAPTRRIIEQDLAYIMYTSGSTGVPKGMMHSHRSGLGFARWGAVKYGLTSDDRVASHAPLHFDLSIFDFFSTSQAGATCVIVPEPVTKFPASFAKLIESERMTVIFTVPFALIQLLLRGALDQRDLTSLRWVLFGGEPFPTKHLRALMAALPNAQFSNMYGPAETPGCTTYEVPVLSAENDDPIPIGTVSANRDWLVLDENDESVDVGEIGEMLIRGPSLTLGYWQRPNLNAKAFYHRPKFDNYADIFYRTGDLVQQRPDGNFMFLGRKDRQIKSRGYRVELDEVEACLVAHPAVEEVAVFPVPDGEGSHAIHAAVILAASSTVSHLLTHARANLPAYAVPHVLTVETKFPRTTSDKIDRRALQAAAANTNRSEALARELS